MTMIAMGLVACGGSGQPETTVESAEEAVSDPPNEGVILVQELLRMVERSGLRSLPSDPEQALQAIATLPDGLGDVIAMHLGRLYPTPDELTPGVGPLIDLLAARVELLLSGGQGIRLLEDLSDGEL
ncbi:MAG: hypothetical protein RLN67_08900, partial [Algiphilus sp.]